MNRPQGDSWKCFGVFPKIGIQIIQHSAVRFLYSSLPPSWKCFFFPWKMSFLKKMGAIFHFHDDLGGGTSNIFWNFHPKTWGKMNPNLTNIFFFRLGWFNHQPVMEERVDTYTTDPSTHCIQVLQVDLFIGAFLKQESLEKAGHGGVSKKQTVINSQMVDDEWSWYILIDLMICDDFKRCFSIHSADFWSFFIISLFSFLNF